MNLGYKTIIDNDGTALKVINAAGAVQTVKANVTDIHVLGLGKFAKGKIVNPVLHRAVPGSVGANTITITAGTLAAISDVTLQLEVFSSRNTAAYSRQHQSAGKLVSFTARVAAGASATVIADALAVVIAARETLYGDLPFTVDSDSNATLVLTGKAGNYVEVAKLAYDAVKVITADSQTRVVDIVTAAESVTMPAEPVNDGAWIEENVAMNTMEAVRLGSVRPLESVDRSALYSSIYFEVTYTDAAVAEPSSVGALTQSGTIKYAIYLKETALPAADTVPYAVLMDIMSDATGFAAYEEDGSAIEGVDLAAVQDFCGYGAGDAVTPDI